MSVISMSKILLKFEIFYQLMHFHAIYRNTLMKKLIMNKNLMILF